jgi:hypothetical protein
MKTQAQRAQQQNRARGSPTGTTCLIGKPGLMEPVLKRFSASSCSPSGAKISQMGVSYPATPQIYNLAPEIPPNAPNSERDHPPATSGIVVIYLLAPPAPCSTPPPYYTPPPSHSAPSAYQILYPLIQNMLFVILTNPGSPAGLLFSLFFGWWVESGVDTSALWEQYPDSCIRVASRGERYGGRRKFVTSPRTLL